MRSNSSDNCHIGYCVHVCVKYYYSSLIYLSVCKYLPVNEKGDEPIAYADPHREYERGDEEQGEGQLVAAQQTIKEFVVVSTDGIIYIRTTNFEI